MARYRVSDVMVELSEFALELVAEIRQQLHYHRASVYKQDTAQKIGLRVEALRAVVLVLNDETLQEVLRDYEAMAKNVHLYLSPGECALSVRVTHLLQSAEPALKVFQREAGQSKEFLQEPALKTLLEYRRKFLAVCRPGSRPWELLKNTVAGMN